MNNLALTEDEARVLREKGINPDRLLDGFHRAKALAQSILNPPPRPKHTKLAHHACFENVADMDAAAEASGYTKVVCKTDYNGFHYERPPGPCPEHNGQNVFWTQKYGVSRVGGFGMPLEWQTYSY